MKIHILTIGQPRLSYAKQGWEEYSGRLKRLHEVRVTHLSDKFAYDAVKIQETIGKNCSVIMEIEGKQYSSPELAEFLTKRELESREVSFVIGGPEGLPQAVIDHANYTWSIGKQTLPHDLAMVVMLEALYRASTINANLPYHK